MKWLLQIILFGTLMMGGSFCDFGQSPKNGVENVFSSGIRMPFHNHTDCKDLKANGPVDREKCGEIASSNPSGYACEACRPLKNERDLAPTMTNVAIFGDDFRLSNSSFLNDAEDAAHRGTGMMVCPSIFAGGGYFPTTVNKVGRNKFIGVSHGIIPFPERQELAAQMFGVAEKDPLKRYRTLVNLLKVKEKRTLYEVRIEEKFNENVSKCSLAIIAKDGVVIERVKLQTNSVATLTYGFDVEAQRKDLAVIKTTGFSKADAQAKPNKLQVTTKEGILDQEGTLYGFHSDLNSLRKVKSVGRLQNLARMSVHFGSSNIVGHDIDTSGWASGALIYGSNGVILCMHIGGDPNPDKRVYNGNEFANICRTFDAPEIEFIKSF